MKQLLCNNMQTFLEELIFYQKIEIVNLCTFHNHTSDRMPSHFIDISQRISIKNLHNRRLSIA